MHLDFSDIIAAISLAWTAITFGRTVRHRPEASWMNSYIVTRLPNATPSLHLQRSSPKEHIGADMQEFGKLVYLIRTESDSASAFLRDSGP